MPLAPGTRIGRYEVTGPLGAGGMGEVYRARDSRLSRDVALKALPEPFRADPDRVERFEREARVLAALNHPHIAGIYGLEESETSVFIVLELVEGGTLADRLAAGPIAIREALVIARDVADALQAAHDKGIIHRDLKPANIALTPGGKPKVLDFGLAKVSVSEGSATTVAGVTGTGVVLGTAPYMSPEQTRGLAVDKRSDIWSFGCVLYQMLTGRFPFAGQSTSDIVVAILEREPDLEALPAATPGRIRWLLRRCLEKDPTRRLHDIADARIELDEALTGADTPSGAPAWQAAPPLGRASTRERAAWGLAALAAAGLIVTVLASYRGGVEPGSAAVYRAALLLPEDLRLSSLAPASRFALSPDGRRLAFVALSATGVPMLWVRPLDSLVPQPLTGSEGALFPFWSPDSRSIAFFARPPEQLLLGGQGRLRRIDLAGGQVRDVADVAFMSGGAWSRDDVILFTPAGNSGLFRVPAAGGPVVAASTLDTESGDAQHAFPAFLPNGRQYVYTVVGSPKGAAEARAIYLGSLDGNEPPRLLLEGGAHAQYASGHLLFVREGAVFAQRLDLDTVTLQGEAFPVVDRVQSSPSATGGAGAFSVSDTGVLVYQAGLLVRSQLAWTDLAGNPIALLGEEGDYADVALSHDGSRVAVSAMDPQLATRDIWIIDVARGTRERVTSARTDEFAPVWSPRDDRIAYTAVRAGGTEIYERSASGSGPERMLDPGGSTLGKFAASWSPDGASLLFIAGGRALARSDLHVMSMDRGGHPRPFLEDSFVETQARFSPDGRWVAYAANESGRLEVYVRPFEGPGEKQRVSIAGGGWPRWRSDGREIFFLSEDGDLRVLMSAPVAPNGDSLNIRDPTRLFTIRLRPMGRLDAYTYDVSPDGQRFLFNTFVDEPTPTGLTLLVNWPASSR